MYIYKITRCVRVMLNEKTNLVVRQWFQLFFKLLAIFLIVSWSIVPAQNY